ncbi:MAG: DUF512 domain-containing protein [Clostridiales bacterium]|nr:DUF512 domain-containing protein [Clostridiales bacterium]
MAGTIAQVLAGSIAAELGMSPGDKVLSVNGQALEDLIDYRYHCAAEYLELLLEKPGGERMLCEIEKEADEDLGLIFCDNVFDGMRLCVNNCLFCFMEQLPAGCRPSLYLKDDDYRLSFLQGNFITGTNLGEADLARIEKLSLSPLYISIHATGEARRRLLRSLKAGEIMPLLRRLREAGISFHGQVVLCPGINDGEVLEATYRELLTLRPHLLSLALVPVGLTAHGKNRELVPYDARGAAALTEKAGCWQKELGEENFIFLADEFYLLAGKKIPPHRHYEDFPQLENGVGMARLFWTSWRRAKRRLPARLPQPRECFIVTGVSGQKVIQPLLEDLAKVEGLHAELLAVENKFFGPTVTVSGLLTGTCLISALKNWREGREGEPLLLLPANMLKCGEEVFLDDMTVTELEKALRVRIRTVEPDGESLLKAVLEDAGK